MIRNQKQGSKNAFWGLKTAEELYIINDQRSRRDGRIFEHNTLAGGDTKSPNIGKKRIYLAAFFIQHDAVFSLVKERFPSLPSYQNCVTDEQTDSHGIHGTSTLEKMLTQAIYQLSAST